MTRIGFAYNIKPESVETAVDAEGVASLADEEPPSSRRDPSSRTSHATAAAARGATVSPIAAVLDGLAQRRAAADDEYAEWDTEETIGAVERALAACGQVIRLEANDDFPAMLRAARPDIVFNIAEGLRGPNREAHVPAICEFYGIPYSGSDPYTLALCLDKARTKEMLAYHGIPTAPFGLVRSADEIGRAMDRMRAGALRFPLFAKPVHEGSSKGITERNYCRTEEELDATLAFLLARYRQPVLVEEFLPGAEFTCAVLGNGNAAEVLPIVGMNFAALPGGALPIYGFEAKWVWDSVAHPLEIFECPARIGEVLRGAIEEIVLRAYRVLGCRDWSRIDVRLDAAGVPNVVEVNPLPGILPNPADNSCFPKAARATGLGYDELIQACLAAAAERQGVSLDGTSLSGKAVQARRAGLHPAGAGAAALG